jgi:hypothetical protein
MKKCPAGKIVNPKTDRCVSKTGKIGQELLNKKSTSSSAKVKSQVKTASVKKELNNDVLGIIAQHADSETKRTLKQVNKHFKTTTTVSPSRGRKNGDFLLQYIQNINTTETEITLKTYTNDKVESVTVRTTYNKDTEKTRFHILRKRFNELQDVIGDFQIKDTINIKSVSAVIKKAKLKYMSTFLENVAEITFKSHLLKNAICSSVVEKWIRFLSTDRR